MQVLHLRVLLEEMQRLLLMLQTDQLVFLARFFLTLVQTLEILRFSLLLARTVINVVVEVAWVGQGRCNQAGTSLSWLQTALMWLLLGLGVEEAVLLGG